MAKRRLLLADDSATIQKVVNLTFSDEGIEVITASDGDTAMEKFVQVPPDLVMIDVNMPGIDGYKICEMIKQDEKTKQIPVILLVGSFEPFDEVEARRVGADDYLTKPFQSIRHLVNSVSDLLNRSKNNESFDNQNDSSAGNQNGETPETQFKGFSQAANQTNFDSFEDAGIDDEMIQTDRAAGFAVDESQDFLSASQHFQSAESDFNRHNAINENDSSETEFFASDIFQPNSSDSSKSNELSLLDDTIFDFDAEPPFSREGTSTEFRDEPQTSDIKPTREFATLNDDSSNSEETNFNMTTQPQNDSFFDFDDLNLLDIPVENRNNSKSQPKTVAPAAETEEKPVNANQETKNPTEPNQSAKVAATDFPPEVIEAIAQKIAEKLADKVLKEITKDIVPQTTELILEEMARNKANKA